jgi:pimeloyl-ACP methyl ester carboxylesterase
MEASFLSTNKSTNGRPGISGDAALEAGAASKSERGKADLALDRTRAVLRGLDRFSPRLAARAAEPLFMTPKRHRRPASETLLLDTARRSDWLLSGRRVPVYSWGEGPVVLFSHGWEGRGTQVEPFLAPLLERGYRVVAWDQPGHGEADNARVTVMDFADVLERIALRLGGVHAVIGHSLGGTAAAFARSRTSFGEQFVTIASPLHPREFLAEFARVLQLSPEASQALKQRLGARYGLSFEDFDLSRVLPQIQVPALVIHDRADREVPYQHGLELARHWPAARLMSTEGLGHRRILRAPEVVSAAVAAVTQGGRARSLEQVLERELFEPALRAG